MEALEEREGGGGKKGESENPVHLKALLREFKGKLHAPEEVFKDNLFEEEEFERNSEELPWMSFKDFQKQDLGKGLNLKTPTHRPE
ncbi:hypothetical protein ZIOFF_074156 [Zingiber officinale]|uniref:Uncharacterized protein n=1 Tax=Zingiber officinale TaxID=94328 RepID=A0A8J5ET32_ZINOF|nr:hypothetical protein ZIOFF_074156 [Zingiber officinale]